jgi:hypothetical protein
MRNLTQITTAVGVATVAAAVLAACGGGSGGTAPAAASTPTVAVSGAAGTQAYIACLRQHGVNIPTTRPTNRPTDRPSGGFFGGGGGGFFGGPSANPQMQAAQQACASLRPAGGFGGFGGRGGTQLAAFRNCMAQQGVTLPTARPTAFPTVRPTDPAARYLGGLNPNDPKVAAALKVCSPLLPSPGARPSSSTAG